MQIKSFEQIARELYAAFRASTDGPPWHGLTHAQQMGWVFVAKHGLTVYEGWL